jgi:hypothetical protein
MPSAFGVDIARFGSDRSIMYLRQGDHVRLLMDWQHKATTETAGRVVLAAREYVPAEIRVDRVGVGGGVVDQLAEQGFPVWDVEARAGAQDSLHFLNARAEWYWSLRKRFERGEIDIDPNLQASLDLCDTQSIPEAGYKPDSKDHMKRPGMPSHGRADALMLSFAELPSERLGELVGPDDLDEMLSVGGHYTADGEWFYASPVDNLA